MLRFIRRIVVTRPGVTASSFSASFSSSSTMTSTTTTTTQHKRRHDRRLLGGVVAVSGVGTLLAYREQHQSLSVSSVAHAATEADVPATGTVDESPSFRFGVVADVQYANADDATNFAKTKRRRYRNSLVALRQTVAWWNAVSGPRVAAGESGGGANDVNVDGVRHFPLTFIAQLGDLIDGRCATDPPPTSTPSSSLSSATTTTSPAEEAAQATAAALALPLTARERSNSDQSRNATMSALRDILTVLDTCVCQRVASVVGNHELYNFDRRELLQYLGLGRVVTGVDKATPDGSGSAANITVDVIDGSNDSDPMEPRSYYAFCPHPDWRVLVLDSYGISTIGRAPHHPHTRAARQLLKERNPNDTLTSANDWFKGITGTQQRYVPFNGGVDDEQLVWLEDQLRDVDARRQRCIVLCHIPLEPAATSGKTLLWNYEEVTELLHTVGRGRVVAVMCGHDHTGGYAVDTHGVHHVTMPSPLEILTDNVDASAIIDVFSDRLELTGHGIVKSRVLPFPPVPSE